MKQQGSCRKQPNRISHLLVRIFASHAEKGKVIIMKIPILLTLSLLAASIADAQSLAENWHQWSGPENNGVSKTAKPPLEWSETKNLAWKVEIQGHGTSSPIVFGDKVL